VAKALPVFDNHRPPELELLSDCVHCGFCLPNCPTYMLWGNEADSPRGRIYLMKLGLEGELKLSDQLTHHIDNCLGCMACVTSCPSGVQYDKLIEATRSQIERRFKRPGIERAYRRALFEIFPYPARLRLLAIPLWLYQRSGLRRLLHRSRLLRILPKPLRAMEQIQPNVAWDAISSRTPATPSIGVARLRVGLLLGCVQRVFFDRVNQATARVLSAEGCDVIVPPDQGCCGALMGHCGEEALAMDFARKLIDAFEAAKVDVIAINSAGCGSAMKEYGHLLRDDPKYSQRAKRFADKCQDISEILCALEPRARRRPLKMRVAFHDACHLQHAQRITGEPRRLLASIPELELLSIEDPAICCGSAGIYNLLRPDAAQELGERKARSVAQTQADVVVSGNPGCSMQIASSLDSIDRPMPVMHWIELLDASISGTLVAWASGPSSRYAATSIGTPIGSTRAERSSM
jgi:glycolate oxidase iron-sulfur subunit